MKYLESAGLADLVHPDDDHQFVSYRLPDDGFQVLHELRRAKQQAEWRDQQREWESQQQAWRREQQDPQTSISKIDNTLTAATIILAETAIVQSLYEFSTLPEILAAELDAAALVLVSSIAIVFVFWFRGR